MNDFKDKYKVNANDDDVKKYTPSTSFAPKFSPDEVAKSISQQQAVDFAKLVKDTPNQDLIAYKDPKVQELVDFIMSAIILENSRINGSTAFPIQIYRRYKSDESLGNKIKDWSQDENKVNCQVPDYLGFKIIPESEPSTLYADNDSQLQELIDKREEVRAFVVQQYKELSRTKSLTYDEYFKMVSSVLTKLQSVFPMEAVSRKIYYENLKQALSLECSAYSSLHENSDEPIPLEKILDISKINIKQLLAELQVTNPNEVVLYKLKKDLLKTFEDSELLQTLGISISEDPARTKRKSMPNGYRSEFIGLDLTIITNDHEPIILPIECQLQTMEQYRDGNVGMSAHFKMPNKGRRKLKNIPGTLESDIKYKSPTSALQERTDFLSWIMHVSPSCAIARITGHDFETGRTVITPYDLYEAFRLINRVPKEHELYKMFFSYLEELYSKRKELFPTGEAILPKYITFEEIPNLGTDVKKFNSFFGDLRNSLEKTLHLLDEDEKSPQKVEEPSK